MLALKFTIYSQAQAFELNGVEPCREMATSMSLRTAGPALGAALLFGASTPLAKLLGVDIGPQLLAGLLYLGSGLGLGVLILLRHLLQRRRAAKSVCLRIPLAELPCWRGPSRAGVCSGRCS
jgi:hypothetical protein